MDVGGQRRWRRAAASGGDGGVERHDAKKMRHLAAEETALRG